MVRNHDPIAVLGKEHRSIEKVVAALDRLAGSASCAEHASPGALRDIVRFMRKFADRCHHAKEEDVLFPAMQSKGVPESGCPLGALRKEHQQGRKLVTALAEATESLAERRPGATEALAGTVRRITALYTNHIWKEDEMVFPMVARLFSEDERAALFEQFRMAEERSGTDHEALASLADALDRGITAASGSREGLRASRGA